MTKLTGWRMFSAMLSCALITVAASAQTLTTLFDFDQTHGEDPYLMSLVQGVDGNFYGTTVLGGDGSDCNDFGGCGTVFKITSAGKLTTLYSFCVEKNCQDGNNPVSGLVLATDGNFYGTTWVGGDIQCILQGTSYGCGTVFRITAAGALTTIHTFRAPPSPEFPAGTLVQGSDGFFYGTTAGGGGTTGFGSIFRMTSSGVGKVLQDMSNDDPYPYAGLIQGADGNFYGTTIGTVFRITPAGALTVLYTFCLQFPCTDGSNAYGALVQGTGGDFYGTTVNGGASSSCTEGCGTVFKITPNGTLTTLHSFSSTDGSYPYAGLVQATDGNFYGVTSSGGLTGTECISTGCGTIFTITAGGALTTLYSFSGADGANPYGGLFQSTNGELYGATSQGGTNDDGTVFSLSVGLGPFVETLPGAGKVGSEVGILGNSLTGATSVTFNGARAQFTVKSPTLILTHVPDGATTGTVQVALPSGTLSSNVPFQVIP